MCNIILEYTPYQEGVKIIGMTGRATEIAIPSEIEGLPVIAIGQYAFAIKQEAECAECEAELTLVRVEDVLRKAAAEVQEGAALQRLFLPETVREIGAYAFSGCTALSLVHLPERLTVLPDHAFSGCAALEKIALPKALQAIEAYAFYDCRALERLHLPERVEQIGKYAFYNCRNMTEINIPQAAINLGMGLFLNCDHLHEITFGRCQHIADLTAVLNQELHLTIDFPDGERAKLLIPDFQYEYIEDTPARQFHQINYGTGHLFRQCIGNSDIDFRRFDELFYLTRREDGAELVLLLAMYRLEYPYRLQEKRKADYMQYLKEHFLWAFSYYAKKGDLHTIRLFAHWGLLTQENMPKLLEISGKYRKTEITGFLLQQQHARFAPKQKTFDL